jgi:hypothetical protein
MNGMEIYRVQFWQFLTRTVEKAEGTPQKTSRMRQNASGLLIIGR